MPNTRINKLEIRLRTRRQRGPLWDPPREPADPSARGEGGKTAGREANNSTRLHEETRNLAWEQFYLFHLHSAVQAK
jgi:hypothetical protein